MDAFLETERLSLRRFTPEDGENLLELDRDPEVRRYLAMPEPPTRAMAEETLRRFLAWHERYDHFGFWAAVEKASGAFLGWFHFRPSADSPDDIELGYRLKKAAWGKGYATEVSRELIRRGFTEWGVRRVVARALVENAASIRVMEKVGMALERRYLHDNRLESALYALDASTWRELAAL